MNTITINNIQYNIDNIDQSPLLNRGITDIMCNASHEDVLAYINFLKTDNITTNFNPNLYKIMGHDVFDDVEYTAIRLMERWNGYYYEEHGYEHDPLHTIQRVGPISGYLNAYNIDYCHDGIGNQVVIGVMTNDDSYDLLLELLEKTHHDGDIDMLREDDEITLSFKDLSNVTYRIVTIDDITDMLEYTHRDIMHGNKYYRSIISGWKIRNQHRYKRMLFKELITRSYVNNNVQLLQWNEEIPELEDYMRGQIVGHWSTYDHNILHIHLEEPCDDSDIVDILSGSEARSAIVYPARG